MFIELREKVGGDKGEGKLHLINLDNVTYFWDGPDGMTVVFGNQAHGLILDISYQDLMRLLNVTISH